MRLVKIVFLVLMSLAVSYGAYAKKDVKKTKTAEEVWANVETLDQYDEDFIKAEIKSLPMPERVKLAKMSVKDTKRAIEAGETASVWYVYPCNLHPAFSSRFEQWCIQGILDRPCAYNYRMVAWYYLCIHRPLIK